MKPPRRLGTPILTSLVLAATLSLAFDVAAQNAASSARPFAARGEQGARWADLRPAQRAALRPLEREWAGIDTIGKQKWLELATRFPKMPADEQSRVQERMAEWAKLTPAQRLQARMNFQEAKQMPSPDRQARWEEYQALTPEQKQLLAARAARAASAASGGSAEAGRKRSAMSDGRAGKATTEPSQMKSNIVANPSVTATLKPLDPAVVQARPGATTSPLTRLPAPPPHQRPGLPKIAATPEFVDKATLLPQRGPQGAAARPASAPAREPPATRR